MTFQQKTLIGWYRHDVINRTTFIYLWRSTLSSRLMHFRLMHVIGYVNPTADQVREKTAIRHALAYKGATK